jgi:hypothetical protein
MSFKLVQKVYLIILFILFFINSSCKEKDSIHYSNYQLNLKNKIDNPSFGQIISVYRYDKDFFFTDYTDAQILCFDSNYDFKYRFGDKGKGPGELLHPGAPYILRDTVYLVESSKQSLQLYDLGGDYIKSYKLPSYFTNGRFYIDDSLSLFGSIRIGPKPIIIQNLKTGDITRTGNNYNNVQANALTGFDFLCMDKNHLIVVAKYRPLLYKMNKEGFIIDSLDLASFKLFEDHNYAIELLTTGQSSHSSFTFFYFKDAAVFNSRLFVLAYFLKPNEPVYDGTSKLIEFSFDNGFKMEAVYEFQDVENTGGYSSFCLNEVDDTLEFILVNSTLREIHVFQK